MISSRTLASDSAGHRATSVGTVETTVIAFATSHGPTSTPLRTSARGAGTRQPPYLQASHISSQLASKATDRPAITRSPTPSGSPCRNIRDSASTKAAALRWVTATPFGVPVEPEVKMTQASSSRSGSSAMRAGPGRRVAIASPAPTIAATSASPKTSRARSSGSSASTGTYAAPASRIPRMAT